MSLPALFAARVDGAPSVQAPGSAPPTPLRVVHLTARLVVGGMEYMVLRLLRGMPATRYASQAWCLEAADILGEQLRQEGEALHVFGRRHHRDAGLFLRIAVRCRRDGVDILHCHDELSWFYGALAARLAGVPHVLMTMHGRRPDVSRRHRAEQRLLARLSACVISVSGYLDRQICTELAVPASKRTIIHNGIACPDQAPTASSREEARRRLGVPAQAVVVGSVGQLAPVKNFGLLLEAVAQARQVLPTLRAVLIGDGPLREALTAQAVALGLGGAVTFAGTRHDVDALLPALDVYACTSHYEGISLSILEAMAAERPVIATAVGGNPEIIADGDTGLLVPPADSRALAEGVLKLAADPTRRARMGEASRRRVQAAFGLEQMLGAYDRVYQGLQTEQPARNDRKRQHCGPASDCGSAQSPSSAGVSR
jgi:glycosyltransferase involved in cell wall biosynthesis